MSGNKARTNGGGLYNLGQVTATGTEIEDNTGTSGGGGIHVAPEGGYRLGLADHLAVLHTLPTSAAHLPSRTAHADGGPGAGSAPLARTPGPGARHGAIDTATRWPGG